MTDIDGAVQDLQNAGVAIGAFTDNEDIFRALFDAFRAWDADSFRRLLAERELLDRCELVCEWVRSKNCVLLCLEVAGPPPEGALPGLPEFAEITRRITEDEELRERLASSVVERDRAAFESLLAEVNATEFAHLLCRWVCTVYGRLICRVVCADEPLPRVPLVDELARAGEAVAKLAADPKAFSAAARASAAGDCELLRNALGEARLLEWCGLICEWFCTWRCVRVCLLLCREFPFEISEQPLSEAFEFAKAAAALASQPETLRELTAQVAAGDIKGFQSTIERLEMQQFCIQLCHWICSVLCRLFCVCVCPNPTDQPWFTTVGHFDIETDIDLTTGKTNKGMSYSGLYFNGGPNFAFYGCLQFGGFCPSTSPSFPGAPMKYRFLYDDGTGPVPITNTLVCPVQAGTRIIDWPVRLANGLAGTGQVPSFQTVQVSNHKSIPVPPAVGHTWYPPPDYVIQPDPTEGWVSIPPDVIGDGFQVLLGFNTAAVFPGGDPAPGVPAGSPVPSGAQRAGTDLSITFEAARVTETSAEFTNSLSKIHVNNWTEVNLLNFVEYSTGCCTPIDASLGVEFTVDHEEMDSGAWSLYFTTCSTTNPGDITPTATTAGVTVSPRGGSGTITEDTSKWLACSYVVHLDTRPGLTTGLIDRTVDHNYLPFCICGHH
jgi:hypothetical protein